jgi:enterochelin esterase-like enzyme
VSRFGKIELSDPQYERDNLRFLTFNSPAMGGRGDVALFVPPNTDELRDLPLVLLLHGVYCSHWAWAWKGGAHITAAEMIQSGEIPPMILAMPSDGLYAEGSGYLALDSADYESWISDDVVGCVTEILPQLSENSSLFIAGLSMGGYGALRIGAKYATRFNGISGHSSVIKLERLHEIVNRPMPLQNGHDDSSVLHWLQQNRAQLPPFRFDCGADDHLIESNRQLHQQLLDLNIAHQYQEFPGAHTWPYWTQHLRDTLRFFGNIRGQS